MTLVELITDVRRQIDDVTEPYLWSDDEITDYLDEAEDALCEDALCLPDQEELGYEASTGWLALPQYIVQIRAVFDADGRQVQLCNRAPWEELVDYDGDYGMRVANRDWLLTTDNRVRALVTDLRVDQVRLYPIPTVAGTLTLDVFRRPKAGLLQRGTLELTDRKHQRLVVTKACALAYGKHDAEAYNPQMAQALDAEYRAGAEELLRATRRRRRHNGLVSYGGL